MIEKCKLAAVEIADLEALNTNTVSSVVGNFEDMNISRLIITDHSGKSIYDSLESNPTVGQYVLYPEIAKAMQGNNVFYWNFKDGTMRSTAAIPVYTYGTLIACVYMLEYDQSQGTLFATLQNNIFTITLFLEAIVVLFSLIFTNIYTRRLRRIMSSIRTVKKGDYSHKITMGGHDELNALSTEFNDLIDRLQKSEKKRSRFVSDASHELKTPLASIKLLSDSILQNNMDIDTIREFVSDIGNEADRLNRMSQKLLALSRADGEAEPTLEITYIAPTIHRVVRMLHVMAAENQIEIQTEIRKDNSILILEDDLYQIVFNLIENGIKYNKHGGTLKILVDAKNNDVLIRISDTGVGIPQESLEHIFERFYRVDKARSRSTGGSGLGLSIVRNIVERNRGKIAVTSVVGQGTEFTITFPTFNVEVNQQ